MLIFMLSIAIRFIGFFISVAFSAGLHANPSDATITLDPADRGIKQALAPAMDYWMAPHEIDPRELVAGQYDHEFIPYENRSIGPLDTERWLRFTLQVKDGQPASWILNLENGLLFDVELVYQDKYGQLKVERAGLKYSPEQQLVHHHYFAIPIDQSSGLQTYYLRVQAPFFTYFAPTINDTQAFLKYNDADSSLSFLFVGLLSGILIYLIVLLVTARFDVHVIEYATFNFVAIIMILYTNGFMTPWMNDFIWLKKNLWVFIHVSLEICYLLVNQRYFDTKTKHPHIHRYINICIALSLLTLVFWLFMPFELIVVGQLLFIGHLIVMLTALSIYMRIVQGPGVSLFITGNVGMLIIAGLASIESTLSFHFAEWLTKHSPAMGFSWQAIFFTAALSQQIGRLREEKNRLEAESKAKSDFIAKMSHEIRTPMNGVIGMAQLLRKTRIDDEQAHYLNVIENSGKTLVAVINDILDYSRLAAGKMDLSPHPFNLEELLAEMNTLFSDVAHAKGLSFNTVLLPTTPAHLYGDSIRLRQILTNLLSNAFKFTDRGVVILKIKSIDIDPVTNEPADDESVIVHFSVKDTGIGISEDDQKMLFRNFGQIDNSLSRRYGGAGLGLSISRQLVELMGGQISLSSSREKGSEFSFTVRFSRLYTPAHNIMRPAQTLSSISRRILVAEDNEISRNVFAGYLDKMGLAADFVVNGKQALEKVMAQKPCPYRMILMDAEMPLMDGFEATRHIREHQQKHHESPVVIVALSAHNSSEHRAACLAAGMNDCIEKPVSYARLQSIINHWSGGLS